MRGIYITANDRVMDHAIACLNSIRLHDPSIPVMLIPYSDITRWPSGSSVTMAWSCTPI